MFCQWRHPEREQPHSAWKGSCLRASLWLLMGLLWLLGSTAAMAKEPAAKAAAKEPVAKAAAKAPAAQPTKAPAAGKAKAPAARNAEAPAARKTSDAFKPVDLSAQKNKPGWDRPYLLAAYGVVWLVLMIYIIGLSRRMRQTDADLLQIQRRLSNIEED